MSDNNVAINLIRSGGPRGRLFGRRTLARCCGALVVGMLLASLAQAALPLYRWTNDQGRQEYSHSISSDMVIRGYDVLDGAPCAPPRADRVVAPIGSPRPSD